MILTLQLSKRRDSLGHSPRSYNRRRECGIQTKGPDASWMGTSLKHADVPLQDNTTALLFIVPSASFEGKRKPVASLQRGSVY